MKLPIIAFLCFPLELKCFSHTILKTLFTVAAVFLTVEFAGKETEQDRILSEVEQISGKLKGTVIGRGH